MTTEELRQEIMQDDYTVARHDIDMTKDFDYFTDKVLHDTYIKQEIDAVKKMFAKYHPDADIKEWLGELL